MTAYRRIYDFGHTQADCRGPGSAVEPYAHLEYGTTLAKQNWKVVVVVAVAVAAAAAAAVAVWIY